MSDKLIIPLDGKTDKEIDYGGVVTFIGFERLRLLLHPVCDIDEDERISGFMIDKTGITIKIDPI